MFYLMWVGSHIFYPFLYLCHFSVGPTGKNEWIVNIHKYRLLPRWGVKCVGIFQSQRQGKFLHKRFYTLAYIALKKPLENSFGDQAMSRQVSKLQPNSSLHCLQRRHLQSKSRWASGVLTSKRLHYSMPHHSLNIHKFSKDCKKCRVMWEVG